MIPVWQLYKLQKIDNDLSEALSYRDGLDNGENLKKELPKLNEEIEKLNEESNKVKINIKDMELKIATLSDQKKTFEDKLYSGVSSNPKELASWQKEVEQLKNSQAKLEDEVLSYLEINEKNENTRRQFRENYSQKQKEYEDFTSSYKSEYENITNKINELEKSVKNIENSLDEEALSLYRELYDRKDGIAIVKLEMESCGGCFMNLPESVVKKVEKREFQTCPNCGRILVGEKG